MALFKALPRTAGNAKKKGLVPMAEYFGTQVKRGRRKKAASKAGRPSTKSAPGDSASASDAQACARDQGEVDKAELVQGRWP